MTIVISLDDSHVSSERCRFHVKCQESVGKIVISLHGNQTSTQTRSFGMFGRAKHLVAVETLILHSTKRVKVNDYFGTGPEGLTN